MTWGLGSIRLQFHPRNNTHYKSTSTLDQGYQSRDGRPATTIVGHLSRKNTVIPALTLTAMRAVSILKNQFAVKGQGIVR
ncbi:hypothetical protein TWF730_008911 [Orbilia blumenaviensis]|uniref:Uncharacterized protein n=1 Tax=Orbilia blumenaviensis TaxID=1796055 RepID=A0AAV9UXQ4_9PEZI